MCMYDFTFLRNGVKLGICLMYSPDGRNFCLGLGPQPSVYVVLMPRLCFRRSLTRRFGHPAANRRGGSGPLSLGGRPRSLELENLDSLDAQPLTSDSISAASADNHLAAAAVGEDDVHDVSGNGNGKRRKTRDVAANMSPRFDANGNRILRVVRREATEVADLETEKVIQVSK